MYSVTGDTTSLVPGFPIRTSSDPRSVDSSPRHNAASHVLHRLPVPRHPPCALKHLQHKHKKILGRIRNCISDTKTPPPKQRGSHILCVRCSQPLSTNQTPHPTTKAGQQQPTPNRIRGATPTRGGNLSPVSHPRDEEIAGLLSQSPIVCLMSFLDQHDHSIPYRLNVCRAPDPDPLQVDGHPPNRLQPQLIPRDAGRLKSRGAP